MTGGMIAYSIFLIFFISVAIYSIYDREKSNKKK